MLNATKGFPSFSVDDVGRAKKFYGETLGLDVDETDGGLEIQLGDTKVMVYPKDNHVPATFTILNFPVDDVEETVSELSDRGVRFEIYKDGELKTDERGIHTETGDMSMRIAWFKDPAGNFLSVIEEN
jgi:catechol 2,3-dioxygenase-like lactoylglutathione lyase family enzyme